MRNSHIIDRDSAEAIEQNALLVLIEAGERFSLRMNQSQFGRKLAQYSNSGGLIVDEDSAFAS